jgi:hypothetical protein
MEGRDIIMLEREREREMFKGRSGQSSYHDGDNEYLFAATAKQQQSNNSQMVIIIC